MSYCFGRSIFSKHMLTSININTHLEYQVFCTFEFFMGKDVDDNAMKHTQTPAKNKRKVKKK
jgi:hypothetical protein